MDSPRSPRESDGHPFGCMGPEHSAMLPLNLCPEHYMFLLTQSRQHAGSLASEGPFFTSAPAA